MDIGNVTDLEELRVMAMATRDNLNDFFFVTCTILIFAMQAGFSLMEAGLVRSKNVTHVLMESTVDAFIGGTVYWLFGYAFCWGEGNDFIGWTNFALNNVPSSRLSFWFFQLIFANTASTITSGAVAERLNTPAFFVFSVLFTGVMYPIACRWMWYDHGWLKVRGVIDDSGSGTVHMLGGTCSFVATLFVGPRNGRYAKDKGSKDTPMSGHSMTITAVGAYLLIFGFLGYNMSTPLSLKHPGDGGSIALSTINTFLAGAGAAIATLFLARFTPYGHNKWSYLEMINGCIAGLVASCAGCNIMPTWAAWTVGFIAGCVFFTLRLLTIRFKVDDVIDAFPIHFGGGITGMLMTPLFRYQGVFLKGDYESARILGYNAIGVLVLIAWGAAFTSVLFFCMKKLKFVRVSVEEEEIGLDEEACGELAYPAASWEEEQYYAYHKMKTAQLLEFMRNDPQLGALTRHRTPSFMNGKKTNYRYPMILEVAETNIDSSHL